MRRFQVENCVDSCCTLRSSHEGYGLLSNKLVFLGWWDLCMAAGMREKRNRRHTWLSSDYEGQLDHAILTACDILLYRVALLFTTVLGIHLDLSYTLYSSWHHILIDMRPDLSRARDVNVLDLQGRAFNSPISKYSQTPCPLEMIPWCWRCLA